ncbi:flavin reductase [Azospirillum sp. B4]|uniref:flavin reductase n=1 Tax=Azospirillum sp. B4 TaxID=95605 RepID=UPI000347EB0C|nr:flavin reductase [Azospirillum sp. B4]
MVDQTLFRAAMARLGAAVNIITTDGPAGRHGLTASAVCSVTDTPPTVLACVNRGSTAFGMLKVNGVLCVNVLAGRHEALSGRFATRGTAMGDRFAAGEWTRLDTGAPVLADAAVALDCTVSSISEIGTHGVFFCAVRRVVLADAAEGLIYFDRAYHHLGAAMEAAR